VTILRGAHSLNVAGGRGSVRAGNGGSDGASPSRKSHCFSVSNCIVTLLGLRELCGKKNSPARIDWLVKTLDMVQSEVTPTIVAGVCDPGDPTTTDLSESGYNARPIVARAEEPACYPKTSVFEPCREVPVLLLPQWTAPRTKPSPGTKLVKGNYLAGAAV
jgi:hypothetical protein